jgi:hypothetical protein
MVGEEPVVIVAYMAHPVGGDVVANLARAKLWLRYLTKEHGGENRFFIAPWITSIDLGEDDTDPAQRERGLEAMEEVAGRCDEVWLVGARLSTGMKRERDAHILAFGDLAGIEDRYLGMVGPPCNPIEEPASGDLTKAQRTALDAVRRFITARGISPSHRDLCEMLGIASTNGIAEHLRELERKGYISKIPNCARSIRVLKEP